MQINLHFHHPVHIIYHTGLFCYFTIYEEIKKKSKKKYSKQSIFMNTIKFFLVLKKTTIHGKTE